MKISCFMIVVISFFLIGQFALGAEDAQKESGKETNVPKMDEKSTEDGVPMPPLTKDSGESKSEAPTDSDSKTTEDDEKRYALGSLCSYCSYCKFCQLCDKDCPCETSRSKPNCHLCKYCKYCSLCSLCDTVCTPGGIIDIVSSTIYNSLPSFDKETKDKVDKDIESAREWIKEYL